MKGIIIFLSRKIRMIVFCINVSIKLKKRLFFIDFEIRFTFLLLLLKEKLDGNELILEFDDNSIFNLLSLRRGLFHLQFIVLLC